MSALVIHNTHELHQLKKSLAPPPGYSGYLYEKYYHVNDSSISCVRMASCRPGVFLFLWDNFGSYWPEVQPRCRSPPVSFRSLVNQQPKRRSIWILSICGTITHSIPQNTGKTIFSYLLRNFLKISSHTPTNALIRLGYV